MSPWPTSLAAGHGLVFVNQESIMNKPFPLTVHRAARIPGEEGFLQAVVDDLKDDDVKLIYADWLEDHDDSARAAFLRQYVAAYRSMKVEDFPSFDGMPVEWCRMIGSKIVRAMAVHGVGEHRDSWLSLAKPALIYGIEAGGTSEFDGHDSTPVGATKVFGVPDLPPGTPWPTQKDCRVLYVPASGIEPTTPCGFVTQINFAHLAGTQVARLCPPQGLVSIFSCAEIQRIGMVDCCVLYTPDPANLQRTEPPSSVVGEDADEANRLLGPRSLSFSETLELPYPGENSPFPQIAFGYRHPLHDPYHSVLEDADCDEQLSSFGGYTRATSGEDCLPGADWCKLICIQNSIEMLLHICVRNEDLAVGRFDNLKLTWVDFD